MLRRVFVLVLLPLFAAPVAADWLVSRDGSRLETRGPWERKGSAVVFTTAKGILSSVRLSEVDLDASARATAEAEAPRVTAPRTAVEPEPVLVLTDRDVGRAAPAAPKAENQGTAVEQPRESEDPPPVPEPVEVISWQQRRRFEISGHEVTGVLQNSSSEMVTDVGVEVRLVDPEGEVLVRSEAFVDAVSMAARSTVSFRALFPGVDGFEVAPRFEVRSRELRLNSARKPEEGGVDQ